MYDIITDDYTGYTYKFSKFGLLLFDSKEGWVTSHSLEDIIMGKLTVVKHKHYETWKPWTGLLYYYPSFDFSRMYNSSYWEDSLMDNNRYHRGLVFQTAKEAMEVAEKMLKAINDNV